MPAPPSVPIRRTARLADDKPQSADSESVAQILARCKDSLIADWLTRAKATPQLNHLHLSDEERTGHLPRLVDDLVARLNKPAIPTKINDAIESVAAIEHGELRQKQGYTPGMLIHESRILQVTIFGTLHQNVSLLDLGLLLPDVMIIADEVDSQLTQTTNSFEKTKPKSAVYLVKPKG